MVEGACLRTQSKDASAPVAERAAELMQFLLDPTIAAVMPPWGGERAIELLERVDFEALRGVEPKWFLGYSDLSTLQVPLSLLAGWATAHGANLMELAPTQTDALTTSVLRILESDFKQPVVQESSTRFQTKWIDFAEQVDAPFNLTETTRWQRLDGSDQAIAFRGHLMGGCMDALFRLAGTPYGDVPAFVRASGADGAILYLENAEMKPCELLRGLWGARMNGWFNGLAGLLIGRSAAPDGASADSLTYREALSEVFGDLSCPVLIDVDIGHHQPQFTLINGAYAEVVFEGAGGRLTQWRDARLADAA